MQAVQDTDGCCVKTGEHGEGSDESGAGCDGQRG